MLPNLRTLSALDPFVARPMNRLETLFDRVLGEDGVAANPAWAGPPLSMWEDEDRFQIEVELPGFTEQDVDITVHNGKLSLRGERKPQEGRRYLYNSRAFGRFERVIGLPETVGSESVQAELRDGVLHISMPKSPEAKPRKISVNRAG